MSPEKKRQIVRLARSGSLERASSLLEDYVEQSQAFDDPAYLTIKGRLEKDRAKRASGEEALRLFARSADYYDRAARAGETSYPLINAATMALLAGQMQRSANFAERVLAILEQNPQDAETPYWLCATRAEALLLSGKVGPAKEELARAIELAPQAWEDHAATIGQFALLCKQMKISPEWLEQYRPASSIAFCGSDRVAGLQEEEIAAWLGDRKVGYAFGGLSSAGDLLIAEQVLQAGAELHLILPATKAAHQAGIALSRDADWQERAGQIMARSVEVTELGHEFVEGNMPLDVAKGMAIQNARNLQSHAFGFQLTVAEDRSEIASFSLPAPSSREDHGSPSMGGAKPYSGVLLGAGSISGDEVPRPFDTIFAALEKAEELRAEGKGVALDFVHNGDARHTRLGAMSSLAEPGQVLCSKELAYALLAKDAQRYIEHIGDVRSASGTSPLFAIT